MPEPEKKEEFLTIEQVCELLNVKKSWIYHRTFKARSRVGCIPFVRMGRLLRFKKEDVLNYIDNMQA